MGLCKWKSCLKPSRQEEESFSSRVFGGHLLTESSSSAAARHRHCGKAWLRLWGGASHQLLLEGTGCRWQGMGRGRRNEKPLTLDLFRVLPNIKIFSPRSRCTTGPVAASEPKSALSSQHSYKEQWQSTTRGSAPASFPSSPENRETSLLPISLTQHSNVVRIEEQVEFHQLSSCPCMFSPSSASSTRRGERIKNTQINRESPTQHKEGQKINCQPFLKTRVVQRTTAPASSWNCTQREPEFSCPKG